MIDLQLGALKEGKKQGKVDGLRSAANAAKRYARRFPHANWLYVELQDGTKVCKNEEHCAKCQLKRFAAHLDGRADRGR